MAVMIRSQCHHGIAVRKRAYRQFLFMGRNICGNEEDAGKSIFLLRGAGQRGVSAMNGVECTAKESQVHFVIQ